jgi:hypothetical protein
VKVVFPCKGALVLLKQDLSTLKAFYNTSILTSKLSESYKNSNIMVQIGNFNYIPQQSGLVLYKANVLTIEKMRKILGIYVEEKTVKPTTSQKDVAEDVNETPISDNDLLSNPFFQTLKPLN